MDDVTVMYCKVAGREGHSSPADCDKLVEVGVGGSEEEQVGRQTDS